MIKSNCSIILFGDSNSNKNTIESRRPILLLGDSIGKIPWTPYLNVPWKEISDKKQQGCNMAFTLNPDVRVDFDVYTQTCVDKLCEIIWKMKCENLVKKIILVKEYGQNKDKTTKTEETGKLHFHGYVSVSNRQNFEKTLLKTFNKRCQLSHRTLQTKLFRKVEDRTRYHTYMQKEVHNKECALLVI